MQASIKCYKKGGKRPSVNSDVSETMRGYGASGWWEEGVMHRPSTITFHQPLDPNSIAEGIGVR